MERSKALIASAIIAAGLTVGAGVYVGGSGLIAGATDNVGNLQPVVADTTPPPATPQEITVYVDPVTGTATTVAPQAAAIEPSPTDVTVPATVDQGGDKPHGDDHGGDHESEHRGEEDD